MSNRPRRDAAPKLFGDISEPDDDHLTDTSSETEEVESPRRASSRSTRFKSSMTEPTTSSLVFQVRSPVKSPARRHAQRRSSLQNAKTVDGDESDEYEDDDDEDDDEDLAEGVDEDEEPLKIKRIIASRTETKRTWLEIGKSMNSSEIHYGSRWFQSEEQSGDLGAFEERFLVLWSDLSFLHVSWETHKDLVEQADGKTYLTTFFRKSQNGYLFPPDERCDGDYFDPAYCQVERILEVQGDESPMVLDKSDPEFDHGTGRQLLVKWGHLPYSAATYEFERDLLLNEIEYQSYVDEFFKRNEKPSKKSRRLYLKRGEEEYKRLYRFFGDKSKLSDGDRESRVDSYKKSLQERTYKNGGQLRDYQAEGVAWMIANFCNQRSCALLDEMGLGKTLQTAATVDLLLNTLNRGGPVLIVAPLSTLVHWQREFTSWTGLNAIIYHGSAEDRQLIREHEFVYECDRPQHAMGFNQMYLKWCAKRNATKQESPWMVDVVITTPEVMILEDASELAAVQWEALVVDEAQKLKNHKSKLASSLRGEKFSFRHKILLTGTPIQNNMGEFWTLLNFMDPDSFEDMDEFLDKYGRDSMQSKERLDELHEEIRPYLLRRLKEDVEKSVPPKEETLIEVELTVAQKTYYRALYEKNIKFLHKNKKRALDGPSLNNLAMQLRKCCNHLFLLNGVEEEFRKKQEALSEGDMLAKGSGKLVLLDKLLPRLKEQGHRILIFSQFKIMLDVLEDYLEARHFKYERIDGSITGVKRQQAIDRFQTTEDLKEQPFVMMLSTRAGGVGINLTAADTCIIFDSDWNPQAQARCHRIGQTKSVKVYRKTYEMQMFHMSSLKMGLDQAVLTGFEGTRPGENTLSKDEVEKLLRHGAYDIFSEDKTGEGEAASVDFVQQDIDSILQRHSRTVVHDNTGTKGNVAGGTFSKATFKARSPDGKGKNKGEDVDIEDPDFWKKMIGEGTVSDDEDAISGKRQRTQANYSEQAYKKQLEAILVSNGADDAEDSSYDSDVPEGEEREQWGGSLPSNWKKDDAERLAKGLATYGYCNADWENLFRRVGLSKQYPIKEVARMCWSMVLYVLLENARFDAEGTLRKEARAAEKSKGTGAAQNSVLAIEPTNSDYTDTLRGSSLRKNIETHREWLNELFAEAVDFARTVEPRGESVSSSQETESFQGQLAFDSNVWPSLQSRGWVRETQAEGKRKKIIFVQKGKRYARVEDVLKAAVELHPELENVVSPTLEVFSQRIQKPTEGADERGHDVKLTLDTASMKSIAEFLEKFGPLQLVHNRKQEKKRIHLSKKMLSSTKYVYCASALVKKAVDCVGRNEDLVLGQLTKSLDNGTKLALPKGTWSSRHDAVLVVAIAKHGWIENDVCARAISGDESLKWGPPFDSLGSNRGTSTITSREDIVMTARRAVNFLNQHTKTGEMLTAVKSFSPRHLVLAYDLVQPTSDSLIWSLDEEKLLRDDSSQPIDLPPKKDMIRRAKMLLSGKKLVDSRTNYAMIDQDNQANTFLCEILRIILREPSGSKYSKSLCAAAAREAEMRLGSISKIGGSEERKNMYDVLQQIETVKRHLAGPAVQYKNLIRAIIGEEIQFPRKEGERVFPPISLPTHKEVQKESCAVRGKPTGEEAIEQAQKRMVSHFNEKLESTAASSLQLTEIETLILSSAISYGVPVWTNGWESSLTVGRGSMSSLPPGMLDWSQFGRIVVQAGERSFHSIREKLVEVRQEHGMMIRGGADAALAQASETAWQCTQQKYVAKENVLTQARDYCKEPETLAKKTTMLLAKISQVVDPVQKSLRSDNGLGSEVIKWMSFEVKRWATSLDLLDGDRKPLAFTAVEFLDELPQEERTSIEIASVFDKKGCRYVLSQISLLTRLRSVAAKYDPNSFVTVLHSSLNSLKAPEDVWGKMPHDWEASTDAVLLYRLLEFGLSNDLLSAKTSYPPLRNFPAFDSSVLSLSKGDLQIRANQLVRELHLYQTAIDNRISSGTATGGLVQIVDDEGESSDEVEVIEPPGFPKRKYQSNQDTSPGKKRCL